MRTRSSLLAVAASAVLLLASCGGSGGDGASTSPEPSREAATAEIVLGTKVHYAGFALTLDKAVLRNETLVIIGRAENLGPASADPPLNATIDLAGRIIEADPGRSILPMVTSASTAEVIYGFAVPRDADLSSTVLFIGAADFARVQVPLGSVGTLVTNAPVALGLSGMLEVGNSVFEFQGGELRYDTLANYAQAEAGVAYLRIAFSLGNGSVNDAYFMSPADLRLKTPSGELIAPDVAPTGLVPAAGSLPNLSAAWTLRGVGPGTYAFVGLRNAANNTRIAGERAFTL